MLPNEELQKFITEWNFLHSPGSFNIMTKDIMKNRPKRRSAIINLTPLQALELKKEGVISESY